MVNTEKVHPNFEEETRKDEIDYLKKSLDDPRKMYF